MGLFDNKPNLIFHPRPECVITVCLCIFSILSSTFYLFPKHKTTHITLNFQPKSDEREIAKGITVSQLTKEDLTYRVTANSIVTRPLQWHLFKLKNYHQLVFSGTRIEISSTNSDQIESALTHVIDKISSFLKDDNNRKGKAQDKKNHRIFTDTKTYTQIRFSRFHFSSKLQEGSLIWIQSGSATLNLQSGLLRLEQNVQIGNNHDELLTAEAAIWNYKEAVIETIGHYVFLNKNKKTYGTNRQFILTANRIKKGMQGPSLALLRPGPSVLTLLNSVYTAKKLSSTVFGLPAWSLSGW